MYMGGLWRVGEHKCGRGKWPEKGLESIKGSGPIRNLFFWVHSQVMSSVFLPLIFNLEEFFFSCPITLTPTRKVSFLNFCSFTNLNPESQTGDLFSLYKIFEELFISQHVKTQRLLKVPNFWLLFRSPSTTSHFIPVASHCFKLQTGLLGMFGFANLA